MKDQIYPNMVEMLGSLQRNFIKGRFLGEGSAWGAHYCHCINNSLCLLNVYHMPIQCHEHHHLILLLADLFEILLLPSFFQMWKMSPIGVK